MEAHARTAIKSFSKSVKMELGKYIFQLQHGQILTMPASRPMPTIALGGFRAKGKRQCRNLSSILLFEGQR